MNKVRKSLGLLLPSMRISISLALITACMLLSADMLGYTLDEDGQALKAHILSAGYGLETLGKTFASVDFWFGAAVAAGLIAVAIWLRRYNV